MGIMAAYLTAALYVSFYLRPYIGYKAWRSLHYLSFGVFVMGTLHGLFAGTDGNESWALAIYIGCSTTLLGPLAYRVSTARPAKGVSQPVAFRT